MPFQDRISMPMGQAIEDHEDPRGDLSDAASVIAYETFSIARPVCFVI
jgi:hypothetical protein